MKIGSDQQQGQDRAGKAPQATPSIPASDQVGVELAAKIDRSAEIQIKRIADARDGIGSPGKNGRDKKDQMAAQQIQEVEKLKEHYSQKLAAERAERVRARQEVVGTEEATVEAAAKDMAAVADLWEKLVKVAKNGQEVDISRLEALFQGYAKVKADPEKMAMYRLLSEGADWSEERYQQFCRSLQPQDWREFQKNPEKYLESGEQSFLMAMMTPAQRVHLLKTFHKIRPQEVQTFTDAMVAADWISLAQVEELSKDTDLEAGERERLQKALKDGTFAEKQQKFRQFIEKQQKSNAGMGGQNLMNVLTNSPEGFAVLGMGWGALTVLLNVLANFNINDLTGSAAGIATSYAPLGLLATVGSAYYLSAKDSLPQGITKPLSIGWQYTQRFFSGLDDLKVLEKNAQTNLANTLAQQFLEQPLQVKLLETVNPSSNQSFLEFVRDSQIEAQTANKPFTMKDILLSPRLTEQQKKLLEEVVANAPGRTPTEKSDTAFQHLNLIVMSARKLGVDRQDRFKILVNNFAAAERARENGQYPEDQKELEREQKDQKGQPPKVGDLFRQALNGSLPTPATPASGTQPAPEKPKV